MGLYIFCGFCCLKNSLVIAVIKSEHWRHILLGFTVRSPSNCEVGGTDPLVKEALPPSISKKERPWWLDKRY